MNSLQSLNAGHGITFPVGLMTHRLIPDAQGEALWFLLYIKPKSKGHPILNSIVLSVLCLSITEKSCSISSLFKDRIPLLPLPCSTNLKRLMLSSSRCLANLTYSSISSTLCAIGTKCVPTHLPLFLHSF